MMPVVIPTEVVEISYAIQPEEDQANS